MVSLLVRNYSIHFHCCCCYFFFCCCSFCCFCFYLFQSLAHFMSTNTKPSGTIGDTQKTMTISATSFRGCNRFSPLLISSIVFLTKDGNQKIWDSDPFGYSPEKLTASNLKITALEKSENHPFTKPPCLWVPSFNPRLQKGAGFA